jgi:hypothetical protein
MDIENSHNTQEFDAIQSDISKILEYKEKGYLFHGSTEKDIKVIEPRHATDTDPNNTFNNDFAVFASTIPDTCIFGLLNTDSVPANLLDGSIKVGTNKENHLEVEIPLSWRQYMEDNTGTLYILPSESFEERGFGWQVKSKTSVKPVDKIFVTFKHFEALGGKIIWVDAQKEKEGEKVQVS